MLLALALVVLDDQDAAHTSGELVLQPLQRLRELVALDRLQGIADGAAAQRLLAVVGRGHDVHRHVTRHRIAFQLVEDRKAGAVGQVHVEDDRGDRITARGRQAILRGMRDDRVELQLVREIAQDGRKRLIVLDDQQVAPARRSRPHGRRTHPHRSARQASRVAVRPRPVPPG